MKQFFFGSTFFALSLAAFSVAGQTPSGAPVNDSGGKTTAPSAVAQTNLIGEVTAIDRAAGKIVVQSAAKTNVTVNIGEKTVFRRVAPGQTSLTGAEAIKIDDVKIGDRVLIPGGTSAENAAVRQFIVMAREAITAQRDKERESRRARTINGRVTAVNVEKKEIVIQPRGGREEAETLTISAAPNAKMLRYAPDSLKIADAVSGTFSDVRVGDQIRVVGDKNAEGTRAVAEEIFSGSVSRAVGTISEINAARGEVVVKNLQTGALMTVAVGKNTTLGRITPEVADALKQRFERRRERQTSGAEQLTPEQRGNRRRERREQRRSNRANGDGNQAGNQNNQANGQNNNNQAGNRNPQQLFENLPPIKIVDLKKGDAVLMTATSSGTAQLTAVSIVTGAAEMQQILQQSQGGGRGRGNMSPGLPGTAGGGSAGSGDDDPRR